MPMTERKVIRLKFGLLELAKQLGRATQACRVWAHERCAARAYTTDRKLVSENHGPRRVTRGPRFGVNYGRQAISQRRFSIQI